MKKVGTFATALSVTALLSIGAAIAAKTVLPQGPEPDSAADPVYTPQRSEPMLEKVVTTPPSLSDGKPIDGPAAGPEPYHAPNPS